MRKSERKRKEGRKEGRGSAEEVGHGTDNFPCSGNLELSPGGKKRTGHIRKERERWEGVMYKKRGGA